MVAPRRRILAGTGKGGRASVRVVPTVIVPACLLALTALAAHAAGRLPEELAAFLRVYPGIVVAAGVLLGLWFRRGRVVLALLALAVADLLLARFGPGAAGVEVGRYTLNAAAFLLPLDLAWLAVARERGTLTVPGLLRLGAIALQPPVAAFVWLSYQPRLVALLESRFLPGRASPEGGVAHPALIAYAAALVTAALVWALRRTTLDAGFAWALIASFLGLAATRSATLYLATAGLILVVALLETTLAMAFRDGLTSLPSRRAFDEAVGKLSGRYAIAMVDIDHFKAVNDQHGHDVGDQVLRMVAARMASVRGGARAYRVGGEEFAIVFTKRRAKEVMAELESLRAAVAVSGFVLRSPDRPARRPKNAAPRREPGTTIAVTVSIGIADRAGRLTTPEEVVKTADKALYRAKRGGRNRVCAAAPSARA
jgi:diguanylate cyclase (GGDEF)-like protein